MKHFVVILKGKKLGHLTSEILNTHVDHLKKLSVEDKLVLCGPFTDSDGAIQVLKAQTLEEAQTMIEADPMIKEGYYKSYNIKELVLANEENNFLLED